MTKLGAVILPALLCLALGWFLGQRAARQETARVDGQLAVLKRDLTLRPDQVAALARLLAQQDRDLQHMVEQAREQLAGPTASRLQRTEDEMLALLDSQQKQRYLALVAAPDPGGGR